MAAKDNTGISVIAIILAIAALWYGSQHGFTLGAIYPGGPTGSVGPNCQLNGSGSVMDNFVCRDTKCEVTVTFPSSALTSTETLNRVMVTTGNSPPVCNNQQNQGCVCIDPMSSWNVYRSVPNCGADGVTIVTGSFGSQDSYNYDNARNLGCDQLNCVISYEGTYATRGASGWCEYLKYRDSCSFRMKASTLSINKEVIVSDKGQTQTIKLQTTTNRINDAAYLTSMRSLEKIYLSNGGVVSATGATIAFKNYDQCVDCAAGTGVCPVGTTQCLSQTEFQTCNNVANNCGSWGTRQTVSAGQVCSGNSVICQNECSGAGKWDVDQTNKARYRECLPNSATGCFYYGSWKTCEAGTEFDSTSANGGSCSYCLSVPECADKTLNAKWQLSDTSYGVCEIKNTCTTYKVVTCAAGQQLDTAFNCVQIGSCNPGSSTCNQDNTAFLTCGSDSKWGSSTPCIAPTTCYQGACTSGYSIEASIPPTFNVGTPITVSYSVKSLVGGTGVSTPVNISLKSVDGTVLQSTTKTTDTYGSATVSFAAQTPGSYKMVATVAGVSKESSFSVANSFQLQYFETAIVQWDSAPIGIGLTLLDQANVAVKDVDISIAATLDGSPLLEYSIEPRNDNQFYLTFPNTASGTAHFIITLSKTGYATQSFTKDITVQPNSLKIAFNAVGKTGESAITFASPGTHTISVSLTSIANNLPTDANVSYIVKGVSIPATRVSAGTYTVSYNFRDVYYDTSIRATTADKTASKRIVVSVFGGEAVLNQTTTGNTTTTSSGTTITTTTNQTTTGASNGSPSSGNSTIMWVIVGAVALVVGIGVVIGGKKRR